MTKLVAIDDDEDILEVLDMFFKLNKEVIPNYELFSDAKKLIKTLTPDVYICIVDYYLKGMNGIELIKQVTKKNPYCGFIMFSGMEDFDALVKFVNISYGAKFIRKGSTELMSELLFHIKDITKRMKLIETFFVKTHQSNLKAHEANKKLDNSINELSKLKEDYDPG